jgi:hypothetical protein
MTERSETTRGSGGDVARLIGATALLAGWLLLLLFGHPFGLAVHLALAAALAIAPWRLLRP